MIGQKIPGYVKEFSKQEISSKDFTVKHSSVLRVMSKWAEYLENLFKNAENLFKQRAYPFKTVTDQLVTPIGNEGTPKLIRQLGA